MTANELQPPAMVVGKRSYGKCRFMKKSKPAAQPKSPTTAVAPPTPVAIESAATTAPASHTDTGFPIVGIGASAGGLAAFEAFFSGMPADTDPGMAFVLVQHLAPDHKSILTDLIRRYTRMQVFEVEDGMTVQPNCAYIIPPNCDMAFLNGTLQLLPPAAPRGRRLPIDFFFRSLAADQHERAICIVLSGTGSDGTLGLRAIKGTGGMAMAQNPASTEYDGMPRSALATGLVDYELPPAEMPAQLIAYVAHAFGKLEFQSTVLPAKIENALKKIFVLIRVQTGNDFSEYKPSTVHRRIDRRMAVHQIDTLENYVKYLQQTPVEVEALFRDLLIGVTNFFRDPETFKILEDQIVPKLFAGKRADTVIRVWSTGCSTGEEAYSLAILLAERQEAVKQSFKVQVFATDIDSQAIAVARLGRYPASIAADLTPERLARFFTAESDGSFYRINKGLRDMLIFSEQNLAKDPPFSKLDLISCRNLLIYMGGDLQKKLIPLFHYALNPGGYLFLGTSETVGEFSDLFAVHDRKAKVYQCRDSYHSLTRATASRFLPPVTALEIAHPRDGGKSKFSGKLPLRELTEQTLLKQIAPAGVLVNSNGDILYLHGRTGRYLEPTPGESGVSNILKMAREGLKRDLTTALHNAVAGREIVRFPGLRVKTNGDFSLVNLTIHPVLTGSGATAEAPLYLVVLEELPAETAVSAPGLASGGPAVDEDARIAALKQELHAKEEYLQTANEELETSNEELKSSNEEMQSVNEELQSTNEELETSKEELQSVNEELATVNTELNTKVSDLSRVNNDMNNLLAGTGIGTVFVDHQLRILRFTPATTEIINLIPSDVGRPVGHIVSNLRGYDHLVADVKLVLNTLIPKTQDVQTQEGQWYTLRILPYRTVDNVIEGAVITFVNITEKVQTAAALQQLHQRMETMLNSITDGLLVLDKDWRYTYFSETGAKLIGLRREDLIGECVWDLFPAATDTQFDKCFRQAVATNQTITFEEYYPAPIDKWLACRCYPSADGLAVYFHDITIRKQAEESLRKANELLRLAVVVRDSSDAVTVQDLEGRILAWNPGAEKLYGWSEAEALALNIRDRTPVALQAEALERVKQLSRARILEPYLTKRLTKSGSVLAVSMISTALVDPAGQMYAIATTERVQKAGEK